jgi:hypothetical protein
VVVVTALASLAGLFGKAVDLSPDEHQPADDDHCDDKDDPVLGVLFFPMKNFPHNSRRGQEQVLDDAKTGKIFSVAVHVGSASSDCRGTRTNVPLKFFKATPKTASRPASPVNELAFVADSCELNRPFFRHLTRRKARRGEVAEWFNAHAWKA